MEIDFSNVSSVYKEKKKKSFKKCYKIKIRVQMWRNLFQKHFYFFQNLAIYFYFSQFGKILWVVFQKSFEGVGIQQNVQTFSFNPQNSMNLVLYNGFNKLGFFSLYVCFGTWSNTNLLSTFDIYNHLMLRSHIVMI